ncbi:hypothetical protein C8Q76DRAFT_789284 [Earliella scabrosa]|nr:hypothetical protein C8Q76DRAFT_789284 [Earliella scabrosa]
MATLAVLDWLPTLEPFTWSHIFPPTSAILYYSFALTLPLEVEVVWNGRFSWGTALYLLNRYGTLLVHLPHIYGHFIANVTSEKRIWVGLLTSYDALLAVAVQGVVSVLMLLRTYALYNCNRRVLALLVASLTVSWALSIWVVGYTTHVSYYESTSGWSRPYDGSSGCISVLSRADGQREDAIHLAMVWAGLLLFDVIIFCLTLARAMGRGLAWRQGLFFLILRDGTMNFGILIVFYLCNVLTFAYAEPGYQGLLAILTGVLSSDLVARAMLNLRDHGNAELPYSEGSGEGSVRFHDLTGTRSAEASEEV